MKKQIITVDSHVRYLSQIKDFELPNGIFNKVIPNCGGTTLALEDDYKTIICSPRNALIINKHDQYPDSLLVIGDTNRNQISSYLENCSLPKIMVSYDSLYKVLDCIDDPENWRIVVDEFQCILSDSSFKSETEIKFLENLKNFPYVTYMSATPILDRYIEEIDLLKDIDYYELDWKEKETVKVIRHQSNDPLTVAVEIINNYKNGIYPSIDLGNGEIVESKECVIFLNSATNIVNMIKNTNLSADQVSIIMGSSEENDKLIRRLGKDFKRGSIPLKGSCHKQFTFCTSTAYAGCDFYSTNASTFVVSDCKRSCTSVDIATELVQIAGRQRLEENPFRKILTFIYNTSVQKTTESEFMEEQNRKDRITQRDIVELNDKRDMEYWMKRKNDAIRLQKIYKFTESYTLWDEKKQLFVYNRMAMINEKYCFDLQQYNYENGIVVQKQLEDTKRFTVSDGINYHSYSDQIRMLIKKDTFEERMMKYCEYKHKEKTSHILICMEMMERKYDNIKYYYEELGADKIKALSYKEAALKKELFFTKSQDLIRSRISSAIEIGHRYTNNELKAMISSIYKELGVNKTGKATDILSYYPASKSAKIKVDNKIKNGYLICF